MDNDPLPVIEKMSQDFAVNLSVADATTSLAEYRGKTAVLAFEYSV